MRAISFNNAPYSFSAKHLLLQKLFELYKANKLPEWKRSPISDAISDDSAEMKRMWPSVIDALHVGLVFLAMMELLTDCDSTKCLCGGGARGDGRGREGAGWLEDINTS